MIKIALLGSTGSIGKQVLQVVDRYSDKYKIVSLTANSNAMLLGQQINKYKPKIAGLTDPSYASQITELPKQTSLYLGKNSLLHAVCDECDIVFVAVVGFAGLQAVHFAISKGKKIALANKETLVAGGELIMNLARQNNVDIIPVDSEHSAIFQCLNFDCNKPFKKLILTASGGAFRDYTKDKIQNLKASEALKHPNWLMGSKITIDCATMLNKGLEVIEAIHLYQTSLSKVKAVVHRESIVHSMVSFDDGTTMAQMSYPSMDIPIQLALTFPKRQKTDVEELDLIGKNLTFDEIDYDKFPCFNLALESYKMGYNYSCAMNSANEEAVKLYLQDKIKFYQINEYIEHVLAKMPKCDLTLDALMQTDSYARELVLNKFKGEF